jgi:hypothetical protein
MCADCPSRAEAVSAHLLRSGDVVRVEGQGGWYILSSAFQEGTGGPMDLDLLGEDGRSSYNWHVGPEHRIEQRI